MRIYVASSWRNDSQPEVVRILRGEGHEVYDFKNPREGDTGFHWTQVGMPTYELKKDYEVPTVPVKEYLRGIEHPIAQDGFKSDFDAMKWADGCVLVLPCGRSAHLELGWFVGKSLPTCILLDGPLVTPELMYLMVDRLAETVWDVADWAGVA